MCCNINVNRLNYDEINTTYKVKRQLGERINYFPFLSSFNLEEVQRGYEGVN